MSVNEVFLLFLILANPTHNTFLHEVKHKHTHKSSYSYKYTNNNFPRETLAKMSFVSLLLSAVLSQFNDSEAEIVGASEDVVEIQKKQ